MNCHGCNGKGWVSPTGVNAVICPVCAGSGVYASKTFTAPSNPDYVLLPKITCESVVVNNKPIEYKNSLSSKVAEELNKYVTDDHRGLI